MHETAWVVFDGRHIAGRGARFTAQRHRCILQNITIQPSIDIKGVQIWL
jgi:hypothetical protein